MNRLIVGSIATGLAAATANASILIDSFDTGQTCTANMTTPNVANTVAGAGILGGEREMFADWVMGANEVQEIANSSSDGYLNFSLGADTAGMGKLVWDGNDNNTNVLNPTGLGGLDLTEGGAADRFAIGVVFDDLPLSLRFTVYTDAGNYSQYYLMLPGGIFGLVDIEFAFNLFTPVVGAADFSNVGAIKMDIFPDFHATDLQIDYIETRVPTPGPVALVGLAGLIGASRRRR